MRIIDSIQWALKKNRVESRDSYWKTMRLELFRVTKQLARQKRTENLESYMADLLLEEFNKRIIPFCFPAYANKKQN